MQKQYVRGAYLFLDYIAAALAWGLFYMSRKIFIENLPYSFPKTIFLDKTFYLGIFLIPIGWLLLYYISGYYNYIFRKSRLNDVIQTFTVSLTGVVIVFFLFILDDIVHDYRHYYLSFIRLFALHYGLTVLFRVGFTSIVNACIRRGIIQFNTLLIGGGLLAEKTLQKIQSDPSGYRLKGYVAPQANPSLPIPYLGTWDLLEKIIVEQQIEEAILAENKESEETLIKILDKLEGRSLILRACPELFESLKNITHVQMLYHTPFIGIVHEPMPLWQQNIKQITDIVLSFLVLVLLSPLFLFIIIGIKLTSPGPVLYKQERIGKHGKPFLLYKFRSMYVDAEKDGPQLTRKDDKRLTPFGRFLRRTKLDELPNFINVLKGDISIVGPRAERKYFIDQIVPRAPHYLRLLKIKPGITSLGQIKYGYASTIDEMIQRLRYDIIYLENMSLFQDLKIIFYTILILLRGRGV